MSLRPLPSGVENFNTMITNNYYYVDKTLLIKELLDKKGMVNLFTRPRRFGKTLNMSMLQHFFDILEADKASAFNGLKIVNAGEEYLVHQNHYPVINLTLKSVEGSDFSEAFREFQLVVIEEFERHQYVLENPEMSLTDKDIYRKIIAERLWMTKTNAEQRILENIFEGSLDFLSRILERHYRKKVVILIDEYNVPLEKAYLNNYYDEMLEFIRAFFHMSLKTNDALEFAIMTGCLSVSRESIFTGFNHLQINGITSSAYGECFGFTEKEVFEALSYYELEEEKELVRNWYNGYLFGEDKVYNPSSLISYLGDARATKEKNKNVPINPKPYWTNTSSINIGILKDLINHADESTKDEIETLIQGGTITKPIKEDIVYSEIRESTDHLWNFLFFTGYLKKVSEHRRGLQTFYELKIPNNEVAYIYKNKIKERFNQTIRNTSLNEIYEALLSADDELLTDRLSKILINTISYLDFAEDFYQCFLLAILSPIKGYIVKSNRERVKGRPDIYLDPKTRRKPAIIIEIKIAKNFEELESKCDEALKQIETRKYIHDLNQRSFKKIAKVGIAFCGKDCEVKSIW